MPVFLACSVDKDRILGYKPYHCCAQLCWKGKSMPASDLPSPFKSLSPSLDVFADNWKVLLISSFLHELLPGIPIAVGALITVLIVMASGGDNNPAVILTVIVPVLITLVISMIVMSWLTVGYFDICAAAVSGARPRVALLFGGLDRTGNFLALMFLEGTIIALGLLLFVLPGIYLILRLSFAPYAVVYQRMGPLEALRDSWQLTGPYQLQLFLFGLVFLAIGAVVLSIPLGSLVYAPYANLCYIAIYQMLLEMRQQRGGYR